MFCICERKRKKILEDYEKELGNKKTSNSWFRFHAEKQGREFWSPDFMKNLSISGCADSLEI